MSRKFPIMFAAALIVGVAGLAAANATTLQFVQFHTVTINSCQDVRGADDRTCPDPSCRVSDIAHIQRTAGPTFPVGCQRNVLFDGVPQSQLQS